MSTLKEGIYMKTLVRIIGICLFVFMMSACATKGKISSDLDIMEAYTSDYYTEEDILTAIETAEEYFVKYYDGCTLTAIGYAGDQKSDEYKDLLKKEDADEVIVLTSTFDVENPGEESTFKTAGTYDQYLWILVRNEGRGWRQVDAGY